MGKKEFIKRVLESGFDTGMLEPSDLLGTVTVKLLSQHLPAAVKARLIQASLSAEAMDAQLIVDTVGFENLAEHAPADRVWAVISAAATGEPPPESAVVSESAALSDASRPARDSAAERVLRDVRARSTSPEATSPSAPAIEKQPPPTITEGVEVQRKRRRSSSRVLPPSPPGATTRARSKSKSNSLERKPNVTAGEPPDITATSPPAPPREHERAGTLDRALDALEMDSDEAAPPLGFDDPTRTGQPLPRADTYGGPDSTDVFASDELAQDHERHPTSSDRDRESFEEDTNPGGAARDEF